MRGIPRTTDLLGQLGPLSAGEVLGQLDLIGMNSYYKLGSDRNVQVPEIVDRWKGHSEGFAGLPEADRQAAAVFGGRLVQPDERGPRAVGLYEDTEAVDLDLQKRLYEGYFKPAHNNPCGWIHGLGWTPGDGGRNDRGTRPKGSLRKRFYERGWQSRGGK